MVCILHTRNLGVIFDPGLKLKIPIQLSALASVYENTTKMLITSGTDSTRNYFALVNVISLDVL